MMLCEVFIPLIWTWIMIVCEEEIKFKYTIKYVEEHWLLDSVISKDVICVFFLEV